MKPFDLVHFDVWGPVVEFFYGYRYFVIFVNDFSCFTWLYLLKAKCEVATVFKDFHHLVHTQLSSKIKILRSDNRSEYMSIIMIQYLTMHGIIHQTSCVHTPQQNEITDQKNCNLLVKTRSVMFQMYVLKMFWSQGVITTAYLINWLPSKSLTFISPGELLTTKKPSLSHLKVFGCSYYVHISSSQHDKLDHKAVKCMFLGYSPTYKGYKCYNLTINKLVVNRDVQFDENTPYYSSSSEIIDQRGFSSALFPLPTPIVEVYYSEQSHYNTVMDLHTDPILAITKGLDLQIKHQGDICSSSKHNPIRNRRPSSRLHDYVTYTVKHLVTNALAYHRLSSSYGAYLSTIAKATKPCSFH